MNALSSRKAATAPVCNSLPLRVTPWTALSCDETNKSSAKHSHAKKHTATHLLLHRLAELVVVSRVLLEPLLLLLGEGVVVRVRLALEELGRGEGRGDPGGTADVVVDTLGVRLEGGDDLDRGGSLRVATRSMNACYEASTKRVERTEPITATVLSFSSSALVS